MSGVLIYPESEAKRNAFATEKFIKNLGVRLVYDDYRGNADFVINRTNDYKIAEYYESRGVRVFNPSALSRLANDKQACYDFMEKNGIGIMPTRYEGLPVVKKPVAGHGGEGVIMLDKKESFEDGFVYQKVSNEPGKDLRVFVIGGEIITAFLRESKTDFRSNFCLGGEANLYILNAEEERLVKRIISLVKADYIGIDFVFNDGNIVFNEIEDTVGARMVYAKTDIDIIKLYCDYIRFIMKSL